MKFETIRFGTINIDEDAMITIREGLPGFSKLKRFCLVECTDDHLFMWLQSIDDTRIAFPVIEPQICAPNYKLPASQKELEVLGVKDQRRLKVLCIVTIPENPKDMTANLRAPILINLQSNMAMQVISPDSSYPVRHPIFNDLQRFVAVQQSDAEKAPEKMPEAATKFQIHRLKESGA